MAKHNPAEDRRRDAAFKEVKANPPAILAKTRANRGAAAAREQAVAIALSKSRRGKKHNTGHLSDSPFK